MHVAQLQLRCIHVVVLPPRVIVLLVAQSLVSNLQDLQLLLIGCGILRAVAASTAAATSAAAVAIAASATASATLRRAAASLSRGRWLLLPLPSQPCAPPALHSSAAKWLTGG